PRAAARRRARARDPFHVGGDGAPDRRRLPERAVKVSAVVVSHGHAAELEGSLAALAPQVDELLVIANVRGSLPSRLPEGARVVENERPLSFAANANLGAAQTQHELVLVANPDAIAEPDAVSILRDFTAAHPRCGVAGPRM